MPFGINELSSEVAEVIKWSWVWLPTELLMFGNRRPWDEVMQVVKEATFVLAKKGIRTEVVLKADVRPGHTNMMINKVNKINEILG